ncbi:EFR1 family ferrodoxin [bacterium]|nr:EFR1 family ferrodoxin [bacterium]
MTYKSFIFYCSPAGTTQHVAKVIEQEFADSAHQVTVCELGKKTEKLSEAMLEIGETKERVCLFIGSPVYASHALPLIIDFIADLPLRGQAFAVPFVTWGGATSGLALAEMGDALKAREYSVVGAARVMAVHSLMWELENPVGKGHPDSADDRMIKNLAAVTDRNLQQAEPLCLPRQTLHYQSEAVAVEMRKLNLKIARGLLPQRLVNEELCNKCGVCVKQCPVAALTLKPYPVYTEHCILCFNCMRWCPENAISADLSAIHERVLERAENYQEKPRSEIFIP